MSDGARWDRLREALRFGRVCESGAKYRGIYLSLYILTSPDGVSRAGVSVGKALGNSVARNRAKRLIREALRLNRGRVASPVWLVCVAKKEIVKAGFSHVEADLVALLGRAGVSR